VKSYLDICDNSFYVCDFRKATDPHRDRCRGSAFANTFACPSHEPTTAPLIAMTQLTSAPPQGLLFIWTDIDTRFEDDFNRWYDREHMSERMAIPGFDLARRFLTHDSAPRYLALYRTTSLAVFRSESYRTAFANQSEWSRQTFGRMQNTVRRVGEITTRGGLGEGGFLSLFMVSDSDACPSGAALNAAAAVDGIITAYIVRSDPDLSVPLTGGAAAPVSDRIVIVEGTNPAATASQAHQLAQDCGTGDRRVVSFQHLWSLRE
jgi:hypothetical protein